MRSCGRGSKIRRQRSRLPPILAYRHTHRRPEGGRAREGARAWGGEGGREEGREGGARTRNVAPTYIRSIRCCLQVSSLRSMSTPSTVIGQHSHSRSPLYAPAALSEGPDRVGRLSASEAATDHVPFEAAEDFVVAGSLRKTVAEVRTHISGLHKSQESLRQELLHDARDVASAADSVPAGFKAPRNVELEHLLKEVDSEIEKTKKLATVMRNSPPAPDGNKPGMVPYP